jgi:hypothetical protein
MVQNETFVESVLTKGLGSCKTRKVKNWVTIRLDYLLQFFVIIEMGSQAMAADGNPMIFRPF